MGLQRRQKSDQETCKVEFDEKVALEFQKVMQGDIASNPNFSKTAITKIYLKDIVSKAHFNSVRFFSKTKTMFKECKQKSAPP